jgi:hypothetical protein
VILTGTLEKTQPDGTVLTVEWMIDTDKAELVQVGGEGQLELTDIDLIAQMLELDLDDDEPAP